MRDERGNKWLGSPLSASQYIAPEAEIWGKIKIHISGAGMRGGRDPN